MLDFSQYRLDAAIANAGREAFGAAIAEYPDHQFFAFALTTLPDVQFIECSVNSDRNLEKILPAKIPYSRTVTELHQKLAYKWCPNEWGEFEYFAQTDRNFFARVQDLLARIESEAAEILTWEESFGARRQYVFDMMIAALKSLDEISCFGEGTERQARLAFCATYGDPADAELRARSVNEINAGRAAPALINEFLGLNEQ